MTQDDDHDASDPNHNSTAADPDQLDDAQLEALHVPDTELPLEDLLLEGLEHIRNGDLSEAITTFGSFAQQMAERDALPTIDYDPDQGPDTDGYFTIRIRPRDPAV